MVDTVVVRGRSVIRRYPGVNRFVQGITSGLLTWWPRSVDVASEKLAEKTRAAYRRACTVSTRRTHTVLVTRINLT